MMPQLDFATFPSQLFWLAVNFAILYFLMARIALPRLGKILESRQAAIKDDLSRASITQQEAEQALQTHRLSLEKARAEARGIIESTQNRINAERARQTAELQKRIDHKMQIAEKNLQDSKAKFLSEIKPLSEELAGSMVDKLLQDIDSNGGAGFKKAIGQ